MSDAYPYEASMNAALDRVIVAYKKWVKNHGNKTWRLDMAHLHRFVYYGD